MLKNHKTSVYCLIINIIHVFIPQCNTLPVILNAIFDKNDFPVSESSWFETLPSVDSYGLCALECTGRRFYKPICEAFNYLPVDRTCTLYSVERSTNTEMTVGALFHFRVYNRFHSVEMAGDVYTVFVSSTKMTYLQGRDYCRNLDGHLLEFGSLDEYDAVKVVISGITNGEYWVGANDIDQEGTWVTDKGRKPLNESGLWLWYPNEPDAGSGQEDGALLKTIGMRLCDANKNFLYHVLCEKKQ